MRQAQAGQAPSGSGTVRQAQVEQAHYEKGKALSTAAAFEIDDVIDPAQTRHVLTQTLARTRS